MASRYSVSLSLDEQETPEDSFSFCENQTENYDEFKEYYAVPEASEQECCLCHQKGHGNMGEGPILIPSKRSREKLWFHYYCLKLSPETRIVKGKFEKYQEEFKRGKALRCFYCKRSGATISCCANNKCKDFHFVCAVKYGCSLDPVMVIRRQGGLFCPDHANEDIARTAFRAQHLNDWISEIERIDKIIPRYCSCKVSNDGKWMIECESCKDWFHQKCANLETTEITQYMCAECTKLSENNQKVSPQKVQQNIEKYLLEEYVSWIKSENTDIDEDEEGYVQLEELENAKPSSQRKKQIKSAKETQELCTDIFNRPFSSLKQSDIAVIDDVIDTCDNLKITFPELPAIKRCKKSYLWMSAFQQLSGLNQSHSKSNTNTSEETKILESKFDEDGVDNADDADSKNQFDFHVKKKYAFNCAMLRCFMEHGKRLLEASENTELVMGGQNGAIKSMVVLIESAFDWTRCIARSLEPHIDGSSTVSTAELEQLAEQVKIFDWFSMGLITVEQEKIDSILSNLSEWWTRVRKALQEDERDLRIWRDLKTEGEKLVIAPELANVKKRCNIEIWSSDVIQAEGLKPIEELQELLKLGKSYGLHESTQVESVEDFIQQGTKMEDYSGVHDNHKQIDQNSQTDSDQMVLTQSSQDNMTPVFLHNDEWVPVRSKNLYFELQSRVRRGEELLSLLRSVFTRESVSVEELHHLNSQIESVKIEHPLLDALNALIRSLEWKSKVLLISPPLDTSMEENEFGQENELDTNKLEATQHSNGQGVLLDHLIHLLEQADSISCDLYRFINLPDITSSTYMRYDDDGDPGHVDFNEAVANFDFTNEDNFEMTDDFDIIQMISDTRASSTALVFEKMYTDISKLKALLSSRIATAEHFRESARAILTRIKEIPQVQWAECLSNPEFANELDTIFNKTAAIGVTFEELSQLMPFGRDMQQWDSFSAYVLETSPISLLECLPSDLSDNRSKAIQPFPLHVSDCVLQALETYVYKADIVKRLLQYRPNDGKAIQIQRRHEFARWVLDLVRLFHKDNPIDNPNYPHGLSLEAKQRLKDANIHAEHISKLTRNDAYLSAQLIIKQQQDKAPEAFSADQIQRMVDEQSKVILEQFQDNPERYAVLTQLRVWLWYATTDDMIGSKWIHFSKLEEQMKAAELYGIPHTQTAYQSLQKLYLPARELQNKCFEALKSTKATINTFNDLLSQSMQIQVVMPIINDVKIAAANFALLQRIRAHLGVRTMEILKNQALNLHIVRPSVNILRFGLPEKMPHVVELEQLHACAQMVRLPDSLPEVAELKKRAEAARCWSEKVKSLLAVKSVVLGQNSQNSALAEKPSLDQVRELLQDEICGTVLLREVKQLIGMVRQAEQWESDAKRALRGSDWQFIERLLRMSSILYLTVPMQKTIQQELQLSQWKRKLDAAYQKKLTVTELKEFVNQSESLPLQTTAQHLGVFESILSRSQEWYDACKAVLHRTIQAVPAKVKVGALGGKSAWEEAMLEVIDLIELSNSLEVKSDLPELLRVRLSVLFKGLGLVSSEVCWARIPDPSSGSTCTLSAITLTSNKKDRESTNADEKQDSSESVKRKRKCVDLASFWPARVIRTERVPAVLKTLEGRQEASSLRLLLRATATVAGMTGVGMAGHWTRYYVRFLGGEGKEGWLQPEDLRPWSNDYPCQMTSLKKQIKTMNPTLVRYNPKVVNPRIQNAVDEARKFHTETLVKRKTAQSLRVNEETTASSSTAPNKPHKLERCGKTGCFRTARTDSRYCSDACAIQHAARRLADLLEHKDLLAMNEEDYEDSDNGETAQDGAMDETNDTKQEPSQDLPKRECDFENQEIPTEDELIRSNAIDSTPPPQMKLMFVPMLETSDILLRQKARDTIHEALLRCIPKICVGLEKSKWRAQRLAVEIENALYARYPLMNAQNRSNYKSRVRSLALNIKNDNNPELRERIWFGDLTPEHLSTVDLAELASSSMKKWREEMVRKAEENTIVKNVTFIMKKTHKGEVLVLKTDNTAEDGSTKDNEKDSSDCSDSDEEILSNSKSKKAHSELEKAQEHTETKTIEPNSNHDESKTASVGDNLPLSPIRSISREFSVDSVEIEPETPKVQDSDPMQISSTISRNSSNDSVTQNPLTLAQSFAPKYPIISKEWVDEDIRGTTDWNTQDAKLEDIDNLEDSIFVESSSSVFWQGTLSRTKQEAGVAVSATVLEGTTIGVYLPRNMYFTGRLRISELANFLSQVKASRSRTTTIFKVAPEKSEDSVYLSIMNELNSSEKKAKVVLSDGPLQIYIVPGTSEVEAMLRTVYSGTKLDAECLYAVTVVKHTSDLNAKSVGLKRKSSKNEWTHSKVQKR